jgi:hypothetical protein
VKLEWFQGQRLENPGGLIGAPNKSATGAMAGRSAEDFEDIWRPSELGLGRKRSVLRFGAG